MSDPAKSATKSLPLGRLFRIGLGLLLLGVFGYALVPGVFYAQHPVGHVNADLVTLRAAIDGQLAYGDIRAGQRVLRGQPIAMLRDPPDRDVRLANLLAQAQGLDERIQGLDTQLAGLTPFLERLKADSDRFRLAVMANLDAQIATAAARVKQGEANAALLRAQLQRIVPLAANSFASAAELDRRRAEAEAAQADVVALKKNLERVQQERDAASHGVYLSDSYNNAPYSQQRRDEIELQRLSLATRKADLEAERGQLERQLAAERRRREMTGVAAVLAPVDGILWRFMESNGSTVGTGAALAQIVDCRRLFFEVLRDRRDPELLAIGDEARAEIDIAGQRGSFPAKLIGLRGEADGDRREFALALPGSPEQMRLVFALDLGNSIATGADSCPIGRNGRLVTSDTVFSRIGRRLQALPASLGDLRRLIS